MEIYRAMKTEDNHDACWVCVLWDEVRDEYAVRLTGDPVSLPGREGGRLVYFRRFHDTLAGAGYRIVLSNISRRSLEGVVADGNPDMEDLINTLKNNFLKT